MKDSRPDRELITGVLAGDREAFGVLVQRYQDMVYGVAYAHLRCFHDAQDVVQEVFLKVYQKLHLYDVHRPFGPWLYTLAKRTMLDALKTPQHTVELNDTALEVPDETPGPDTLAERHEMEQQIRRALNQLSDVNRETFCLYYVNGYSVREVGE